MKNKVITLFGGGGFVGRYVAQELLRAGARVRIAQRDPREAWFLKPLGGLGQTQFLATDVRRPDTIARAVAGADAVVNLVGILDGAFDAVQADGARNIAEAAAAAGVRAMVQVSAIGADPQSPSAYGRSKAAGEAAVRAAFPNATIIRPSIIFGREDQFVNRFARMVAVAPIVPVLAPATKFQPVYVADVAAAIVKALAEPGTHGGHLYELGGPNIVSMSGLIRWIAEALGRRPRLFELPDSVGASISRLPGAPITRDQWAMLGRDNVASPGPAGLEAFGITPTPLDTVAPEWLVQYRRHGRFGRKTAKA